MNTQTSFLCLPTIVECRQFAVENGMFVVEKGSTLILYRKAPGHNVRLGKSSTAAGLLKLATRCAHVQT